MERSERKQQLGKSVFSFLINVSRKIVLAFLWFTGGLVLMIVLWFVYSYAMPNFCLKKGRFLSEKEYLYPYVEGLMKSGRMKLDPTDTSVEAYLANHPDCCGVGRADRNFLDVLIGVYPMRVTVEFEMSEKESKRMNSDNETYYIDIQNMSSCGEYGKRWGTTDTPLEPKHQHEVKK
jgi:hypothetical protein